MNRPSTPHTTADGGKCSSTAEHSQAVRPGRQNTLTELFLLREKVAHAVVLHALRLQQDPVQALPLGQSDGSRFIAMSPAQPTPPFTHLCEQWSGSCRANRHWPRHRPPVTAPPAVNGRESARITAASGSGHQQHLHALAPLVLHAVHRHGGKTFSGAAL